MDKNEKSRRENDRCKFNIPKKNKFRETEKIQ